MLPLFAGAKIAESKGSWNGVLCWRTEWNAAGAEEPPAHNPPLKREKAAPPTTAAPPTIQSSQRMNWWALLWLAAELLAPWGRVTFIHSIGIHQLASWIQIHSTNWFISFHWFHSIHYSLLQLHWFIPFALLVGGGSHNPFLPFHSREWNGLLHPTKAKEILKFRCLREKWNRSNKKINLFLFAHSFSWCRKARQFYSFHQLAH